MFDAVQSLKRTRPPLRSAYYSPLVSSAESQCTRTALQARVASSFRLRCVINAVSGLVPLTDMSIKDGLLITCQMLVRDALHINVPVLQIRF